MKDAINTMPSKSVRSKPPLVIPHQALKYKPLGESIMASILCYYSSRPSPFIPRSWKRTHGFRCFSSSKKVNQTPQLLKITVNGVTELLRFFSSSTTDRLENVVDDDLKGTELLISDISDVLTILQLDYEQAYFVTGIFTSAIYADDCIFEDPTIKFRGKDLYARNLKLLVPFFDQPSITLRQIEKSNDSEPKFLLATWSLRTYLKLPWRPLISIDGNTIYELDRDFKIVKHSESWSISALEAVGQIFTPSFVQPKAR